MTSSDDATSFFLCANGITSSAISIAEENDPGKKKESEMIQRQILFSPESVTAHRIQLISDSQDDNSVIDAWDIDHRRSAGVGTNYLRNGQNNLENQQNNGKSLLLFLHGRSPFWIVAKSRVTLYLQAVSADIVSWTLDWNKEQTKNSPVSLKTGRIKRR